jgi:hypothetical protein
VDDFSIRLARGITADDVPITGKYCFRFFPALHRPHGWHAGGLFEETRKTLFCSDLFRNFGNVAPVASSDLIEPTRKAMQQMQQAPLANYMPYTKHTEGIRRSLATLEPDKWAIMYRSSCVGESDKLLSELATVIESIFDEG